MKTAILTALSFGLFSIATLAQPTTPSPTPTPTPTDDVKIPVKDLPKAVVDAIHSRLPGAEMVWAEKDTDLGLIVYEVGLRDKDRVTEVHLSPEGKFTRIESDMPVSALPKIVADAVKAAHPKATVVKAEECIRFTAATEIKYYEVDLTTETRQTLELKLTPEGKVFKTETDRNS